MKTKNNIITKSVAGTLPIALLAAGLILGPWTASARAPGGGAFAGHGGAAFGGHGGAVFAGRGPSFAPAMPERGGATFAERQPSFAPAARAPTIVDERTVTVPNGVNRRAALATIENRLARLDARLPAGTVVTQDVRLHRDRIARTREFLYGLVDLGTPDWEIDAWTDALWQNEIIDGMPSDLVLDYWGNPIATESIFLDGAPAVVWTFRLQPERTERITVARGAVRSVSRPAKRRPERAE
jgi:hypothetical protein